MRGLLEAAGCELVSVESNPVDDVWQDSRGGVIFSYISHPHHTLITPYHTSYHTSYHNLITPSPPLSHQLSISALPLCTTACHHYSCYFPLQELKYSD